MNPTEEAAQRGARWLLDRLASDGSLSGATDLTAYYKTPCALLWSGHRAGALQVLAYARERYLWADGDLDGTSVPWLEQYRIYPHAWLAVGAAELGDLATAQALVRFVLTHCNAESGGFLARADGSEEIMTTSMAGLACLRAGEMTAAAGVARWLETVYRAQPDLSAGLWHVWRSGLVTNDDSVAYRVNAREARQWYFQYGISAAFLAEYARATGNSEALSLARQYLQASAHCGPDVYRTPQSGKIGWGAAWTYRLSSNAQDLALVDAVVEGLRALQCGDGSWNAQGVYEAKPSSGDETRFDVTAEFVALLGQMGAVTRV